MNQWMNLCLTGATLRRIKGSDVWCKHGVVEFGSLQKKTKKMNQTKQMTVQINKTSNEQANKQTTKQVVNPFTPKLKK